MCDSKNNFRFNYEYRDAGNYHVSGYEVFSNPDSLKIEEVEFRIRESLIDSEFFDPSYWLVKRLKHDDWIPELDHTWNRFESLEYSDQTPTNTHSITEFINIISRIPRYW